MIFLPPFPQAIMPKTTTLSQLTAQTSNSHPRVMAV